MEFWNVGIRNARREMKFHEDKLADGDRAEINTIMRIIHDRRAWIREASYIVASFELEMEELKKGDSGHHG